MASSILTKYQNRRKPGQLGQNYRGSVQRYGMAKQKYDQGASALRGLKTQHTGAVKNAEQTQKDMEGWSQNFWQNTDQGKGLQSILNRYSGLGINVDPSMGTSSLQKNINATVWNKHPRTGKDITFGESLLELRNLKGEYDHSLTRNYSGTRWKNMSPWERMRTAPAEWYESYDITASERQKRKDSWMNFSNIDTGAGFTLGDIQTDISDWGSHKSSKTYKDYLTGSQKRSQLDADADKRVSALFGKLGSVKESQKRYLSEFNLAKSSMARMQSMYHGAQQRDSRSRTTKGGTQKKTSILLGYA